MDLSTYQKDFITYFNQQTFNGEPKNLFDPINYILRLEGKRIRPVLTLIASDIFSDNYENALPAAMAIEMFHNFTLVHDDIMDDAPLRRGKDTVHEKWDINAGILSGDAMLILAYQYFESYDHKKFKDLLKLFSRTALEVCQGQQLDIDFETRNDVIIDEYINMIRLKTSVLVGAALKIGAIVADADEKQSDLIYNYGLNLGIAFQLQDDLLDTFGDPKSFGKQVGGDIIENKKTYLYLKALQETDSKTKNRLLELYTQKSENNESKVKEVSLIFKENRIIEHTKELIEEYTLLAFDSLEKMSISNEHKNNLISFGNNLMNRKV